MLQPFPVALFTLVRAQLTFSVSFILLLFISTLFNPVKADGSNNSEYRSYGKTVNYNDRRYRNHKWKLLKAPKTVSPRGKTDVSEETYSWKPVSDAVEYTLVVRKRPTRKWRVRLLSQTITAAQAGCASGEALCSYNPGLALDNGRYKWKVRAISSRGRTSKWSNYRQFRVRDVVVTENNAPMANDVSASTNQGVSIDIMLEATDLDNDSLTYSVDATSDNGGTISLVGSLVTYSPSQDFVGTDTFTFTANDGTVDSNMATVSIAVNRVNTPPEAVDQSISVDENGSVDFTLNASDADGDPLTYTFINQPVSGVLSGEAPNLTYKPDEGFTGEDSFRYFAVDGFSDTANTTVTITVNAVNTPPLAEAGDAQEVFETQKVTLSGSGSDEDGTIASYFWEQTGGTLVSLDGVNSENLVFDADELTADETLTFTLTVTDNEGATATDNVTVLVKNLEIFDADLIICLGDNNNPQELLTLTGLACNNEVVDDDTDFSELEKLVSLTFLDLSGNKLSNLSTLSGLTSLTNLNLSNNQIVDVSALSGLTSLTTLDLSHNQIEDLSGLSQSSSDETVSLRSIQLVSARALSGLTLLTNLNLSYNKIADISSLSELTLLDTLDLSNNLIADVSALSELTAMRVLDLTNNLLIDLPDLTNLINLQQLIIVGNCVEGEESQNPVEQCTGDTPSFTWQDTQTISNVANEATSPAISMGANGNSITVWEAEIVGSSTAIMSRLYNPVTGWGETQQLEATIPRDFVTGDFINNSIPKVSMNSEGNALAVWLRFSGTGYNADRQTQLQVRAKAYNATTKTWAETVTLLSSSGELNIYNPVVAFDDNGNAMISWNQAPPGGRSQIWARAYTEIFGWEAAKKVTLLDEEIAGSVRIIADNNNSFIAVWRQQNAEGTGDIWTNRFSSGSWGEAQKIDAGDSGSASAPKVAVDKNGNAVVVWQSRIFDTLIWANNYNIDNNSWGTAQLISRDFNPDDDSTNASSPDVSMNESGLAIATWSQDDDAFASQYSISTNLWGEQANIENLEDKAFPPQVALDRMGNAIAVWRQRVSGEIVMQFARYDNILGWQGSMELEPYNSGGLISMSPEGQSTVVWTDYRENENGDDVISIRAKIFE